MVTPLQRLALGEALAAVSVIHVAGTKGKARALRSSRWLHRPNQAELADATGLHLCLHGANPALLWPADGHVHLSPPYGRERAHPNQRVSRPDGCFACLTSWSSPPPASRVPVDREVFVRHFWHCYDTLNVRAAPSLWMRHVCGYGQADTLHCICAHRRRPRRSWVCRRTSTS